MTDTNRCGAKDERNGYTCVQPDGHVGMHASKTGYVWKDASKAKGKAKADAKPKPEPTKPAPIDAVFAPPKPSMCQAVLATIRCTRPQDHEGDHEGNGASWSQDRKSAQFDEPGHDERETCSASRNNTWHAPVWCELDVDHDGDHEAEVTVAEGWPEAGEVRRLSWDRAGNGTDNVVVTRAPAHDERDDSGPEIAVPVPDVKAEESIEDRVYALVVAEPGIPTEQLGKRYAKALQRLEGAGRIELLRGGWVPTGPNGVAFDGEWKRLAELGACDDLGGAEYERVRAEYFAAGSPTDIEPFIRRRANAGPDDEYPLEQESSPSRPMTLDDEPEDPEADAIAVAALDEQEVDDQPAQAAQVETRSSGSPKVHPAAAVLPLIEGKEFESFVEDIRVNGLHSKPVLDHSGEWLVDGRNRKRALDQLGIPVVFDRLPEGTNIAAYVISTNLRRRHQEEGARAMCASEIANLSQGQRKTRPGAGVADGITQAEAAAAAGVGLRTVQRANAVRDKAVPELVELVKQGKVDLKGAEQVSKLSPKQQRDLIKERIDPAKGPVRAGKLAAVARQEQKRETVRNINSGKVRPMPVGQFGVIYADYPWHYDNSDQHEGSRGHLGYATMEMDEIIAHALEAAKRAADDCIVALWSTNLYITEMGPVLKAYGAERRTVFTWPKPKFGVGSWGRGRTEHLVIASIGSPVHTLNEVSTLLPSWKPEHPGEHSSKPAEVAELLRKHCGGPFLELFGRGPRDGFAVWGAEVDKFKTEAA